MEARGNVVPLQDANSLVDVIKDVVGQGYDEMHHVYSVSFGDHR
jgi:hypothetical protein